MIRKRFFVAASCDIQTLNSCFCSPLSALTRFFFAFEEISSFRRKLLRKADCTAEKIKVKLIKVELISASQSHHKLKNGEWLTLDIPSSRGEFA